MNRPLLFVLILSAALSACVTLGHGFDAGQVKTIAVGKTTRAEIQKMFGEPFRTGLDSGDETWTFVDYRVGLFGPQRAIDLLVKFATDGTVKSYSFNSNQN